MMRKIDINSDLFVVRALYDLRKGDIESAKMNLDEAIKLFSVNNEAKLILKALNTPQKTPEVPQSVVIKKEEPKNKVNLLNPLH